jgi:hypothetical protein
MNVQRKILFILLLGCALLAQSAIAATIVAASDASASSKATAQYVCSGSSDQTKINEALAKRRRGRPDRGHLPHVGHDRRQVRQHGPQGPGA